MSFLKKLWQNRQSEHPSRRILTNVNTNDIMLVEVARSEGEVLAEGDAFDESNMNDLEERIESAFNDEQTSINSIDNRVVITENQLNGFYFGVTSDGKAGYRRGASTEIIPFKSTEIFYLGSNTSYNIRTMFPSIDYRKLTSANFIAGIKTCYVESSFNDLAGTQGRRSRIDASYGNRGMATVSVSYDPSNGNLNISGAGATGWNYANADNPPSGTLYRSGLFVYLVIGEIK